MVSPFKRRIGAIEERLGVGSDTILWALAPGCELLTGEQIRELMRAVDGKTRGIPEVGQTLFDARGPVAGGAQGQ